MSNRLSLLIFLILVILFSNFVLAEFIVGNPSHSIDKKYAPDDYLTGWINISFEEQEAGSLIKSNLNDSINIIDLIDLNFASYTCIPNDCFGGYSIESESRTKSLPLDFNEEKIIGIQLTGEDVSVNSIEFLISSNARESCVNQLEIDFLDDKIIDIINTKASENLCPSKKNYGCFKKWEGFKEYLLDEEKPYCQKVTLPSAPSFKLGVWVKKEGSENADISLSLYDISGDEIPNAYCELGNSSTISTSGSELSCDIDYVNLIEEEYYVCVFADYESNNPSEYYKIRGNDVSTLSDLCGFYGELDEFLSDFEQNYTGAYHIFAQAKKFDEVGRINIGGSEITGVLGEILVDSLNSYIDQKYNSDCSNGCVIPIRFKSNAYDQTVALSGLDVRYSTSEGPKTTDNFYDLNKVPPKINTGFLKLDINDIFSVGSGFGDKTIELKIGNQSIFSDSITVMTIPKVKDVVPTKVSSGSPEEFVAEIEDFGKNISKYSWYFGDGEKQTTTINRVVHTYDAVGLYEMKIEITDEDNLTSYKTFDIVVGSSKDAINKTLNAKKERIDLIKSQINKFPSWYRDTISSELKIEDYEDDLKRIQREYAVASTNDEFTALMHKLINVSIPRSVNASKSAKVPFFPPQESINLNYLQTVGGGSIPSGEEQEYKKQIYSWNHENLETSLDYKQISAFYEYEVVPLANIFELDIKPKTNINYDYYLIIYDMENLKFKEDYLEKNRVDFLYIDADKYQNIGLSTTEDIDFESLPVFISPAINRLPFTAITKTCNLNNKCEKSAGETWKNCKDCRSWWFFVFLLILLLFIALVGYILLQEWYKRKYEKFLFKNRNDLYNMINYVHNAKKKKMSDEQIMGNLKKSGWKKEQIEYVLKKYSGKRVGMKEIPIKRILEKLKLRDLLKKMKFKGLKIKLPFKKSKKPEENFRKFNIIEKSKRYSE